MKKKGKKESFFENFQVFWPALEKIVFLMPHLPLGVELVRKYGSRLSQVNENVTDGIMAVIWTILRIFLLLRLFSRSVEFLFVLKSLYPIFTSVIGKRRVWCEPRSSKARWFWGQHNLMVEQCNMFWVSKWRFKCISSI